MRKSRYETRVPVPSVTGVSLRGRGGGVCFHRFGVIMNLCVCVCVCVQACTHYITQLFHSKPSPVCAGAFQFSRRC